MKINLDKNLLKYSFYIVLTATALYILYAIIGNIGSILEAIFSFLGNILSILSPFIIALVIAYLLHPMVKWLELNLFKQVKIKPQYKRTFSVLLTYLLIVGGFILFIYSTYVMIGGQITNNVNVNNMIEAIMKYSQRYNDIFQSALAQLETSGLSTDVKEQFKSLIERMNGLMGSAINAAFDSIKQLGSNLINILLGAIIAFYVLKDLEYFKKLTNDCFHVVFRKNSYKNTKLFFHDVDSVVSKFIRGQLLDAIIVGILCSIGLWIIGLDFPVLIGMTAGISNVIPYFGPIIGSIPAIIVGLLSGSPIKALFAVLVLLLVQQIDGAIISPKVVGESVGLHPVFVILSITIGGAYFGLLGMLLAVPAAGIIKFLIIRWRQGSVQ
ncbi:MAG TPA: AI-2E family transporter [Patescibacteria group bacterium]|nr:AI-2E family transporter [Patescibacteria group bacterium]